MISSCISPLLRLWCSVPVGADDPWIRLPAAAGPRAHAQFTATRAVHVRHSHDARPILLSRRNIAFPVMDVSRCRRCAQPDPDPSPLAVVYRIARLIAQHVLVAQLAADHRCDFRYLASIVGWDGSSAAGVGDLTHRFPAQALFDGLQ